MDVYVVMGRFIPAFVASTLEKACDHCVKNTPYKEGKDLKLETISNYWRMESSHSYWMILKYTVDDEKSGS